MTLCSWELFSSLSFLVLRQTTHQHNRQVSAERTHDHFLSLSAGRVRYSWYIRAAAVIRWTIHNGRVSGDRLQSTSSKIDAFRQSRPWNAVLSASRRSLSIYILPSLEWLQIRFDSLVESSIKSLSRPVREAFQRGTSSCAVRKALRLPSSSSLTRCHSLTQIELSLPIYVRTCQCWCCLCNYSSQSPVERRNESKKSYACVTSGKKVKKK